MGSVGYSLSYRGLHTSCFEDLTGSLGAIGESQADDLIISWEFHLCGSSAHIRGKSAIGIYRFTNDQRPIDTSNGIVLEPGLDGGHARVIRRRSHDETSWERDVERRADCCTLHLKL